MKQDNGEGSIFFPTHKNNINDFIFYSKKYRCIKDDIINIQGDYNTARTRSLVLVFEKCDEPDGSSLVCKSDTEIKTWLQRKFILVLYNQKRFRLEAFNKSKIVPESRSEWVPINSQIREEVVYTVSLMQLNLQDRIWQWSTFT